MIYHRRSAAILNLMLVSIMVLCGVAYANRTIGLKDHNNSATIDKYFFLNVCSNDEWKSANIFQGSEDLIMKDHEKICLKKVRQHLPDSFLPPQNKFSCLAIFSSHPEAGKTFISLGIAQSLAKFGHPVLLLDLDSEKSTLRSILHPTSIISANKLALNSQSSLLAEITSLDDNFDYLGFNFSLPKAILLERYFIQNLLEQLADLSENYDFLIFDTPTGMSELNLALLQTKTTAIFVSTTDTESLFDTYALLTAVYPHFSTPDLYFIINGVLDIQSGEKAHQILRYAFQHFLNQEIKLLGMVPLDAELQLTDLRCRLLPDSSPALEKIQQIAQWLADNHRISFMISPLVYHENS
jgi:flagellar biosynthesis protein FlhG